MKKIITILISVSLIAGLFTGCGSAENNTGSIVSLDGSTSAEKVIGYLSEGYTEENNGVKITYNPTGSGSGIKAASEGRCDIGISSRDLTEKERENLVSTVIAFDGIAVVVNPDNLVSDLSLEMISALYKGEVTNWKEVGGTDSPVACIGREAASGTRDGFESITAAADRCRYSQELTSSGDVIQTVASNPNAIGYVSLASVKDCVKAVSVDGIYPSKETIQNGSYKIRRDFVFVTRKNDALSEKAQSFFDFAASEKADELIEKAGAIPVVR